MSHMPQLPLQVTFRNLERSDAVEDRIREKVEKLGSFHGGIMSCRVSVELLHRHHQQGKHFHVRIDLKVPGHELVAGREPDENHAYTDVYVAIRDAFDAMKRQLEDLARHQQGKVKTHEQPGHGQVSALDPDRNCGRIATPDGRELYFHRNSLVADDYDQLQVGTQVRFSEEVGEEGPQASSVQIVGKHHIVG
ncbi:MAG: hypothetical protein RJA36_823 [Pseudomonadota bacterium]|jgi:ribosomal subunit interface protein